MTHPDGLREDCHQLTTTQGKISFFPLVLINSELEKRPLQEMNSLQELEVALPEPTGVSGFPSLRITKKDDRVRQR